MVVTIRSREKEKVKQNIATASCQKLQVGRALMPKVKLTIKIPGKAEPVIFFAENEAEGRRLLQQKQKELEKNT